MQHIQQLPNIRGLLPRLWRHTLTANWRRKCGIQNRLVQDGRYKTKIVVGKKYKQPLRLHNTTGVLWHLNKSTVQMCPRASMFTVNHDLTATYVMKYYALFVTWLTSCWAFWKKSQWLYDNTVNVVIKLQRYLKFSNVATANFLVTSDKKYLEQTCFAVKWCMHWWTPSIQ